MTVTEVVSAVEEAGGALALNGSRIKYAIPKRAAWLVPELQQQREGIVALLQRRAALPPIPAGIRLVRWAPKQPPVVLEHCSVVNDVEKFARYTLEQLGHALEGRNWLAGNWSIRDLVERLEQVGVKVDVNRTGQG
jgi:hypothetical protein